MISDLRTWLEERLARVVGRTLGSIDPNMPFHEFGLESVDLVEISGELEQLLGRRIDPDILYEFSTIAALSDHLGQPAPAPAPTASDVSSQGAVAIVGMACRFPGAANLAAYWRLLVDGVDAISEVPADRWDSQRYYQPHPRAPGKMTTKWGGFIDDVDGFDHGFFGISEAEAAAMDPQQRALLEVCWEAFEDAGIQVRGLRGGDVGVFVGISHNDYESLHLRDLGRVSHFSGAGNALSIAANRLSYQFDFRGPSLAVDTACSSSLTAVHLAVRSLRAGESRVAVAGGVNMLLSPEATVAFSQAGMMAPDGRCKTFDASADGYVRGEGAGLAVLKRFEDAVRDGDRIYAVIRGSAVNQDGRSNGLSAPNPAAQEAVLRAAYGDAGFQPASVEYVEAHGTGTKLGDPIEASALSRVVGSGSGRSTPCLIGSVKANIGHLESAAGVAGLIKGALCCHHGMVPPSLHFDTPNPHIPFGENGLRVAAQTAGLRRGAGVGVSAFGFGGTNCHVVLERHEPADVDTLTPSLEAGSAEATLVVLSAATLPALEALKGRWAARLAEPGASISALARSAALERTPLAQRWAAVVLDSGELAAKLVQEAARPPSVPGKLAFVFPGQGAQHREMALDLYARFPGFRQTLDRADDWLKPLIGSSILEAISAGEALEATATAQPAIVAVQMAVADLLVSLGVRPDMVVGHSVGEIAAAYAAGMLAFDEALTVAVHRGRVMDETAPAGAMLSVPLAAATVRAALRAAQVDADVAAVNAADSTVVAGTREDLDRLAAHLREMGSPGRFINERYGFHSRQMAQAAEAVGSALRQTSSRPPTSGFYSTSRGCAYAGTLDGQYWADNVRLTVDFLGAADAMIDAGCATFVEVGPDAVLSPLLARWERPVTALPAMRRRSKPAAPLLTCLARLFEAGWDLDLRQVFAGNARGEAAPGNPWTRTDALAKSRLSAVADTGSRRTSNEHAALGSQVELPPGAPLRLWETAFETEPSPWLLDHRVGNAPVFPAAAVLGLFQAAGAEAFQAEQVQVSQLTIHRPLLVDETAALSGLMKLDLDSDASGAAKATLMVRRASGGFDIYAEASIAASDRVEAGLGREALGAARARCIENVPGAPFYERLSAAGLQYGPAFRAIEKVWRRDEEALCEFAGDWPTAPGYAVHPGLLDGAFQLIAAALPAFWTASSPWLPVGVERVILRSGAELREAHVTLKGLDEAAGQVTADIVLLGRGGERVGALEGVSLRRLSRQDSAAMRQARLLASHHIYVDAWRERPDLPPKSADDPRILLFLDQHGVGRPLTASLRATGAEVIVVAPAHASSSAPGDHTVDIDDPAAVQRCIQMATADGRRLDAAICLWPTDLPTQATPALEDGILSVASLTRALAYFGGAHPPRLWLVTRGALAPDLEAAPKPSQASIWGAGMAAAFEAPALRTTRIDLDPRGDPASFDALAQIVCAAPADADQFLERAGRIRTRRLARLDLRMTRAALRDDAWYIVTGGAGAIGRSLAAGLIEQGATHVVLMGRRPRGEAMAAGDHAAGVDYRQVDVGDADALAAELNALRSVRPIAGVFHAAGHLRDGALFDLDRAALTAVLDGKARGAWNLHALTQPDTLDVFVLFSSAAASIGSIGQAAYMAANGYLNGLADLRRTMGLPVLCVEWGPWAEAGMAHDSASQRRASEAVAGISMIDHPDGVQLLLGALGVGGRMTILPYDVADLLHLYPDTLGLSLFADLVDESFQRRRSHAAQSRISPRPALAEDYVEPTTELERMIAGIWQRALKIEPIGVRDPFFELGGDSVFAGQVLSEINRTLGVEIEAEAAFEALTIEHLARLADAALVAAVSEMSEDELEAALGSDASASA